MTKCSVTSVEQTKILDPPKECGMSVHVGARSIPLISYAKTHRTRAI